MGMAIYYKRFIPDFSKKSTALNELLRTDQKFSWTEQCTTAFTDIKTTLCTAPVLIRPDWKKPFKLYTDASSKGLGAILKQTDENGLEHVILYQSRTTTRTEKNYGSTKLECLAVVWAIKKLRYYLLGKHFEVITDHSALKWLFEIKDPIGIFARWIADLEEYDVTIKYRKGSANKDADFLSRYPNGAQGGADQ